MYHQHTKCRACGGTDLVPVLDLGVQSLANDFRKPYEECAGMAPLKVMFCRACTLAQLSVVVKPGILYSHYSYVTSKSEMMRSHFEDILDDILGECHQTPKTLLEIGSNDGTFLKFAQKEFKGGVYGVEPAQNLVDRARGNGIETINRPFDYKFAIEWSSDTPCKSDVIVARHVFCHVDDWRGFILGLETISHKDTLVFIEVPHVLDMFKNNSFDQVYHEHLSYMSTTAMQHLLKGTKLHIQRSIHYPIHGGAVGIMLRQGKSPTEQIKSESDLYDKWIDLDRAVRQNTDLLLEIILDNRRAGKVTCGFGASAKATVWISACGFTSKDIAFVCDSTPEKQDCLIPGTDIPIVPEKCLGRADFAILWCWNFEAEVIAKNKAFTDNGGKWIVPCPKVEVKP
jgi:novobiocin biosynthesis protein NovU/D-mycarose 3-C-methyltransferase